MTDMPDLREPSRGVQATLLARPSGTTRRVPINGL
jgi:hypothetical protein